MKKEWQCKCGNGLATCNNPECKPKLWEKLGQLGAFLLLTVAYFGWAGIILGTTYSYPTWFIFLEGIFFGGVYVLVLFLSKESLDE